MEERATEDSERSQARDKVAARLAELARQSEHPEEVDDTLPPHLMRN